MRILLWTLCLSGCAYYVDAPELAGVDFSPGPSQVVVTGSVTQSSDGEPAAWDEQVEFYFRKVGAKRIYRVASADFRLPIFGGPHEVLADPGLEAEHGRLFAIPLEPGEYELVRFSIRWPSGVEQFLKDPIPFTLAPGQAVYLGNFDARFCVRHLYANQYGVAGVYLSVQEKMSRDLPLLYAKYPVLKDMMLMAQVLPDKMLKSRFSALQEDCD